ncbi:MAG: ABC transporter substrate-binding protein [Dehalococcoidia bacterium]|nr:ABC transporter substrate-binding protein [Dehalococcoidia bacterium]
MNRYWLLLLALLALPLAAACGGDDDDGGDLKKVTLMLNWAPNTQHSGIYLALENGWYEDEGIDLEIVEPASAGVEPVVAQGGADIGISAQEYVIPARAEGVPVVSIGAILQHNDSSFFALAKDNITRPKDFEGKKYGGFGGPLESEILNALVQCDGGDPAKVSSVEVGNVDYLPGMEQDRFDFVWVFEGWDVMRASEIENIDVTSVKFVDYLNCIPDWYTPVFIASESKISGDPDMLKDFMAATTRGYEAAIDDPKAAADALLKAAPELDRALVEKSQEYHVTKYMDSGRQWGVQDEKIWVEFEKFLRQAGLTTKEVDAKKAYTNDFLPKD